MTLQTIVRNLFVDDHAPSGSAGFAYVPTRFAFVSSVSRLSAQQITITLSHRNTRESIRFWSAFNVASLSP